MKGKIWELKICFATGGVQTLCGEYESLIRQVDDFWSSMSDTTSEFKFRGHVNAADKADLIVWVVRQHVHSISMVDY